MTGHVPGDAAPHASQMGETRLTMTAWMAGTSPAMIMGHRGFNAPPPRHDRACPGHPRRTAAPPPRTAISRVPLDKPDASQMRATSSATTAWVAGTSPAMTMGRPGFIAPPPRQDRACPGHPRRTAAPPPCPAISRVTLDTACVSDESDIAGHDGVDGRDEPGDDDAASGLVPVTHAAPLPHRRAPRSRVFRWINRMRLR